MALRRRAQQNDHAAGLAHGRRSKNGGHAASDEDDDESASGFNMVSLCMQYADTTEKKNKLKVDKVMTEAKKIASDYAEDIKAAILKEQGDIQAVHNEYRLESQKDAEEKERILAELLQNFEYMEQFARTLEERNSKFEKARYGNTKKCLDNAEIYRAASANHVYQVLNDKREAVRARVEAATFTNPAKL